MLAIIFLIVFVTHFQLLLIQMPLRCVFLSEHNKSSYLPPAPPFFYSTFFTVSGPAEGPRFRGKRTVAVVIQGDLKGKVWIIYSYQNLEERGVKWPPCKPRERHPHDWLPLGGQSKRGSLSCLSGPRHGGGDICLFGLKVGLQRGRMVVRHPLLLRFIDAPHNT